MLGVMIDCSRNAVMNVNSVKRYVDILAKMGYDTLMLYTEDTYEVDNQPFFGYKRGRYSKEEIREIDAYCISKNIELIPCIQTLAHLNCIFKWWDTYAFELKDWDDFLMVGEDKTYALIEDMFATISKCFTSKRIHIGMDEAYMVGVGNYLKKHKYEDRFDIINRHLHKVCEVASKYGLEPMIWSDMFCKLATGSENNEQPEQLEKIKTKAALPESVSLVCWNYYSKECEDYRKMLKMNQAFDREVLFAGGAWTWKGFMPDNRLSMDVMVPAVKACKEIGVENVFFTMWGDDGGECSRWGVLPSLFFISQIWHGNMDEYNIKKKFKDVIGMDFDAFLLFEKLDLLLDKADEFKTGSSKYLFYNDPFSAIVDYKVSGAENEYYRSIKDKLDVICVSDDYKSYFDYAKALCDVLTVKSNLGVRTRNAYQNGDINELKMIAKNEYGDAIDKINIFHEIYQKWWMSENKPQGFDIQDIRIGGLVQRLKSCRNRLLEYCSGEVENIPELEEDVFSAVHALTWAGVATTNVVSHIYF